MAEFVETMRKLRELCNKRKNCEGCIMMNDITRESMVCGASFAMPSLPVEEVERRVAQWEAEKSKYPSWAQAWKQLFPDAIPPCPAKNFGVNGCDYHCDECRARPIPAEIAEKLGIRPKEEHHD